MISKTIDDIRVNIDWLSWTHDFAPTDEPEHLRAMARCADINQWLYRAGIKSVFGPIPAGIARRPYADSLKLKSGGGHLFFRDSLTYSTVELEGQGCAMIQLETPGALETLMTMVSDRVTRLDVAIDIKCQIDPIAFAGAGYSPRFTTYGQQCSETGRTYYIGSPESDIMCRVYRYAAPHPRADFLRVEIVTRRDRAKIAAAGWIDDPIGTAQALAKVFDFKHDAIMPLGSARRLTVPRITHNRSSTLHWMAKQVKPALLTLAADKSIPVSWWVEFLAGLPGQLPAIDDWEREGKQPNDGNDWDTSFSPLTGG